MMYHNTKYEASVMIENFDNKLNWDATYIPYFRIIRIISPGQLEVSDPTGRLWKVNISYVHKILPSDFIVSSIPDEQVFGRKGNYINDPYILKEVSVYRCISRAKFPKC